MRYRKFVWAASVSAFALVAAVLLTASAAPQSSQDVSGGIGQQVAAVASSGGVKLPSLFDFNAYKRLFKKSYSGLLENMARFKLYTSRAIRASISAIKFMFRSEKFHLSINHMSDRRPDELARMRNKVLEREYASTSHAAGPGPKDLPEFIPGDDENVVASLRRLIDKHAGGMPEYEALRAQLEQIDTARQQRGRSPSGRRKREVGPTDDGPRELPLSRLVNVAPDNPDAELPAETRAKIRTTPESNNPLYGGLEAPKPQGLVEQQVPLESKYFPEAPQVDIVDAIGKTLESLRQKYALVDGGTTLASDAPPPPPAEKLPDQVFIDLRQSSNCFFAPRKQGDCGSCYAFAATTVAEWLHCRTTGELVALSEQYVVDCGVAYQADLDGCEGGTFRKTYEFFHNFGWELRTAYPYVAREQQCPYAPGTDLRTVGYIRADLRNAVQYEMSLWPEVLAKVGPVVTGMNIVGSEYYEYGSGVFDKCVPESPDHAVVVVGHGREEGEEYWLIRNSYSVGWGEGGYMKLSKRSDCIWPLTGWSYGTHDGFTLQLEPTKNALNDGQVMEKHYARQLKDSIAK